MGLALKGLLLGLAATLLFASAADAYVLWANKYNDSLGRLESEGMTPNQHFVDLPPNSHPVGVAVDGAHVYWANYEAPDSIGRANLDGNDVRPNFITGAQDPVGVAVDAGHLYWTNAATGTIGRANLDGSAVNQTFIAGAQRPYGLAVDNAQIYWTDVDTGMLNRANLDGTCPDLGFVTGANNPTSLAADSAHLYWVNWGAETIGRVNLDGSNAIRSFIPLPGDLPWGVAVDAGHLYWTNQQPHTIARADLDGSNQTFTAGGSGLYGVAVPTSPAAGGHARSCIAPAKATPDTLAPRLSRLAISRSVFAAARRGASVARLGVGTRVGYTLTENATVYFVVGKRGAGRRVRGRCHRRSRRNRRRKSCTLAVKGFFTHRGTRGRNHSRFSGRLRGRKLRPGRYTLWAAAVDAAGNRSKVAAVRFRIRRR